MKKIIVCLCAIAIFTSVLVACGGAGGGGNGTQNVVTVVPDPCAVPSHSYGDIQIPSSYLGSMAIPSAASKLPNAVVRTIDLKDLDAYWAKPNSVNCTDRAAYYKNVFREEIKRVSALGTNRIWVYNYAPWDDISKPIWTVSESNYALPNEALQFIVSEANKFGIEVYVSWQMNNSDIAHGYNVLNTDLLTASQLTTILESYRVHMKNYAATLQKMGVAGISGNLGAFNIQNPQSNPSLVEAYVSETSSIIGDLRKVFTGKITYGQIFFPPIDSRVVSKVDELIFMLWLGTSINPFSVNEFKNAIDGQIGHYQYDLQKGMSGSIPNISISWDIYGQGTKEFYTAGNYMEDSFCVDSSCSQNNLTTDFAIQAVAIEAALEVLTSQNYLKTAGVNFTNYWHTDEVSPYAVGGNTSFPNVSSSIRNKPAEGIVKAWFSH